MQHQPTNTGDVRSSESKKVYIAPQLKVWGTIQELTLAKNAPPFVDGLGIFTTGGT
jgi:hypothetical protein